MKDAKICDIAPTILHMFGLPLPSSVDGKVLTEMFEKDSDFVKKGVNSRATYWGKEWGA